MSISPKGHKAIFYTNQSQYNDLVEDLLKGKNLAKEFNYLQGLQGALFSKRILDYFIEEETIHDKKWPSLNKDQSLLSMSSGERKKALLNHLLQTKPEYLILINPLDNLDHASQKDLITHLKLLSKTKYILLFISRKADLLPFINSYYLLKSNTFIPLDDLSKISFKKTPSWTNSIPEALDTISYNHTNLVKLNKVSVSYGSSSILNNINWRIRPGEFWKLSGPNGSGKTTLLSMINGDSPKAYGQDIYLLGFQKGQGESVWDLKKSMGYFTPAMIDRFKGYHTLENMIISGLFDSIGLYIKPSNVHRRLALKWLRLLDMEDKRDTYFHKLSQGDKHLIMCIRAMIKHPPLLILDEPTSGLDDSSARAVVALTNRMSEESNTAIIFVSHREEPLLKAKLEYVLVPTNNGSEGIVKTITEN
ncbi:ATP-binding cassette domain-containing protein [Eudoraea chungangensis]|uniref:ATP-binding cassette domain-containing protein n=1 Tax=Eudoraea chungangensis TaxID=1481905 RepID=UPI0023ED27FD|nr:ATP-binding cassette domain-containing protein [Eudoraea chungangensis]